MVAGKSHYRWQLWKLTHECGSGTSGSSRNTLFSLWTRVMTHRVTFRWWVVWRRYQISVSVTTADFLNSWLVTISDARACCEVNVSKLVSKRQPANHVCSQPVSSQCLVRQLKRRSYVTADYNISSQLATYWGWQWLTHAKNSSAMTYH